MITYKIYVSGMVQGVGFRPFIYNLANEFNFNGYIKNAGSGVEILVQSFIKKDIKEFIKNIPLKAPENSEISVISVKTLILYKKKYKDFSIKRSSLKYSNLIYSTIPKDVAICDKCLKELNSKTNRRYSYAFINCINCGPRYSIIKDLPYDRKNTSMHNFKMCEHCYIEYNDKENRRFHAQPNSCSHCGISLQIFDKFKNIISLRNSQDSQENAKILQNNLNYKNLSIINLCKKLISQNKILALKGVGGFNFICNIDFSVIQRLRELKNRPTKPFVVMFRDLAHLKLYFDISNFEAKLLNSKVAPIVLLNNIKSKLPSKFSTKILANVAPNLNSIGVILAYSPLHKMLLKGLRKPIIFTSANISKEPLIKSKEEAFQKISNVFDYLIDYNRDIVNPIDDSLSLVLENKQTLLLRAGRGFYPLNFKSDFYTNDVILALGADSKSQIAIFYKDSIVISPFIGDLYGVDSINLFKNTINLFLNIYKLKPKIILMDMHPFYKSNKIARELSKQFNTKLFGIYHHKAHFYSVLLDNHIFKRDRVLGVIFDGTGFGMDSNIWGGEFFMKENNHINRIFHFKYFPILGGDNAIGDNKKIALGILFSIYDKNIPKTFQMDNLNLYYQMYKQNLNSTLSSSIGRIFDFVAYFCGVTKQSFEGESGLVLESLYDFDIKEYYKYKIKGSEIILDSMFKEIFLESTQKSTNINKVQIASKFINTLVEIIIQIATIKESCVVFSGGVFQNRVLSNKLILELQKRKIEFYFHNKIPPNDGGIALGQVGAYLNRDYQIIV